MTEIFAAPICPFAHRTRALLTHLQEPFEEVSVDLRNRSARLLELSPTGKVPLLVDGDFVLYESDVINDYLTAKLGWEAGWSPDLRLRARQKVAMKQWDSLIAPKAFYEVLKGTPLSDELAPKIEKELDYLANTVSDTPVESLLGFHLAPFWARWDWLRESVPTASLIDARPALRKWLDDAVALPAVQATLPPRGVVVERYASYGK